jgi:hypothetical protein
MKRRRAQTSKQRPRPRKRSWSHPGRKHGKAPQKPPFGRPRRAYVQNTTRKALTLPTLSGMAIQLANQRPPGVNAWARKIAPHRRACAPRTCAVSHRISGDRCRSPFPFSSWTFRELDEVVLTRVLACPALRTTDLMDRCQDTNTADYLTICTGVPKKSALGQRLPPENEASPLVPIYERRFVKPSGAGLGGAGCPHIPLAVGVGRFGPARPSVRREAGAPAASAIGNDARRPAR